MAQSKGLKFFLSNKKSRRRQSRAMVTFLPCQNINKTCKTFSQVNQENKREGTNYQQQKNFITTDPIEDNKGII